MPEIARAWSFTDDLAKAPYIIDTDRINHLRCSCPSSRRRKQTCKHITTLIEECRDGTILTDQRYQITDYGLKYLSSYMKK